MSKSINSEGIMNEIKKALLSEGKVNINNLFTGERTVAFKYINVDIKLNYSLTKYQAVTLLRMSVFHLLQCVEKTTLTEYNNYNCRIIIISLLHMAKDLESENEVTILRECANSIFKNPLVLQNFLPVYKKKDFMKKSFTDTFLEICLTLYNLNKECMCFHINDAYKEKLISLLKSALEKSKSKEKIKESIIAEFFEVLQLTASEMIDLLEMVMELPSNRFWSPEKTSLSIWGIVVPKIIEACFQLNYFSDRSLFPLNVDLFKKCLIYLVQLKACKIDTVLWDSVICKYLKRFPHNIAYVDRTIFLSLLHSSMNSASIELISLLINRNTAVIPQVMKFINKDENIQKSNMIFTFLGSNLTFNWDKKFLLKLYELHKNEIVNYVTEPADKISWIHENIEAVIYLIESSVEPEACQQIYEAILVNGDKLDKVDLEYVLLLQSLFRKAKAFKEFAQVLVHLLASTLKLCKNRASLSKNKKKLVFLCQSLIDTVEILKANEKNLILEELGRNHSWPQFVRFSLTQGLKSTEEENSSVNILLLRALISACNVSYNDNGNDEYIKTIFGLATNHSEYADIMLSSTGIKRYLVELILVLIRKNTSIMVSTHIPFYLATYNATLSESDQFLLLIIKHYEKCNINLQKYRPFLWGNAAASHYSVKEDPNTALWRQAKASQILEQFMPEIVNNTITNFPVKRSLKDDTLCAPENVYDPVFYLPLLCEVLSEHNPVPYHRVTHSGALALMLISCCSNCDQIRLAAYTDLSRFYFHLEDLSVKRSNERLIWIRFIDALRNGIADLDSSMKEISLNGFIATFLARVSIVGTQPLHPLYWPLHKFFMAKPALKLNTIPEFKKLFLSTEVDYENYRHWILEVIRDGFKTENDIQIAINCSVFNTLLSFYVCSLSNKITRKLILEIINSIAKIPKSALLLVNYYGIMPWLDAVTDRLDDSDADFVPLLIEITANFLDSFLKKKVSDKFPSFMLMHVLLTLKSTLTSKNVTISSFTTYVETLEKVLVSKDLHLHQRDIKDLLELAKDLLGCMEECEDLLENGSTFAAKEIDDMSEDEVVIARKSFRKLILRYHSHKKS